MTAPFRICAAAVPYAAVLVGVHALQSAWVAILLYHAGIGAFLAASRRRDWIARARGGWSDKGLVLIAGGALGGALLFFLWPAMRLDDLGTILARLGLGGRAWPLFMIYFVVVHAPLEELHWRGLLASERRGLAWEDVAFAGYHALVLSLMIRWPWVIVCLVVLTGAAWTWRRVSVRRGGLSIPALSHVAADASLVIAADLLTRA